MLQVRSTRVCGLPDGCEERSRRSRSLDVREVPREVVRRLGILGMKKVTKAEARTFRAEWAQAVQEGRILRFNDGMSMQMFPTIAARDAALVKMRKAGLTVEIVQVIG